MEVLLFTVPWAASTLAIIVGFASCIIISLFTKPLPQEHIDWLFATEKKDKKAKLQPKEIGS